MTNSKEQQMKRASGFSMVELMVALVIIAILSAFALPAYQQYVGTADEGVVVGNMETMSLFQEDFFLRNGVYAVNLANIAAIDTAIGWNPQANDGITYSIAAGAGTSYNLTAVHPDGLTVCITYPAKVRC